MRLDWKDMATRAVILAAFTLPFVVAIFGVAPSSVAEAQIDRYEVDYSLRFNTADSAYLNKTFKSKGTTTIWTFSAWVKRGQLGTTQYLISAATTSPDVVTAKVFFDTSNRINVTAGAEAGNPAPTNGVCGTDPTTSMNKVTNAVFRDQSAWMHLVVAVDTTQATAANRNRVYVNGTEITSFSTNTNITQNAGTCMTGGTAHNIGRNAHAATSYFDGLMADVMLVGRQQLTPSSFGYTDSNGYWRPKEFTGTTGGTGGIYGTNGFRFDFASTTSFGNNRAATSSHAFGDFTANNFTAADQLIDTPSHSFANLNSEMLWTGTEGKATIQEGGLQGSGADRSLGSIQMESGKWYWEVQPNTASSIYPVIGISTSTPFLNGTSGTEYPGDSAGSGVGYSADGQLYTNNVAAAFGNTFTGTDLIGVAFDADTGKVWFAKNNTWQASGDPANGTSPAATLTGGPYFAASGGNASRTVTYNFGQGGSSTAPYRVDAGGKFSYEPPSGFKALSTVNLPAVAIEESSNYFETKLYTGTGATLSITGLNFQPDFVWLKGRSAAQDHGLFDSIRTATKWLSSTSTLAERTDSTSLTAFNSDGFTLGTQAQFNTNTNTYVSWNWKESATAGFDIVTYSGNGSNRTISHSLSSAPEMIIIKDRTGANDWAVYHADNTSAPETDYQLLNSTAATADDNTYWNDTVPTASVFSVGTNVDVNTNTNNYVAYLFDEVAGFSSFGTYTGNGNADGPLISTGFMPKYILVKRTDSASTIAWRIYDNVHEPFNPKGNQIAAGADTSAPTAGGNEFDFYSNGFKSRDTNADLNASGGTYIYAAFAEQPFKLSATNRMPIFANFFEPSGETTITDSLTIAGGLSVVYNLSKGAGSFVIDHVLDPLNKLLYHSFVESPDMKNIYDGVATLDDKGNATIELPKYLLALNKDFRYLGSPIGEAMPDLHVSKEVRKKWFGLFGVPVFKISGGAPNGKISWQITGIRHDRFARENPIRVEVDKGPGELVDKGEYLYPELYPVRK